MENYSFTTIPKSEINDWFDTYYRETIDTIYYKIKEKCDNKCVGVLENENNSTMFNFSELLKNNIDVTKVYKKKFKL